MSSHSNLEYSPVYDDDDDHDLQNQPAWNKQLQETRLQETGVKDTTSQAMDDAPEPTSALQGRLSHTGTDQLRPESGWEINHKYKLTRGRGRGESPDASPNSEWTSLAAQLRHTHGTDYQAAESALLDHLSSDKALQSVVDTARNQGDITPEKLDALFHPHPERDQEESLLDYARRLKDDLETGWKQLNGIPWSAGLDDPIASETTLLQTSRENALHHVFTESGLNLTEGLGHPNPTVNEVWTNSANAQFHLRSRELELTAAQLELMQEQKTNYQQTGQLPAQLSDTAFPDAALTVTNDLATLGYSKMHNNPINLTDSAQDIESYLKRQMDAHVTHHTKLNLAQDPADFGRALLQPALDDELGANWTKFDPGNYYYTDDGPLNYYENNHINFLIDTDPTDPTEHFKISYGRTVRDSLMGRGVADNAYMNRPDLLAESYPRAVHTLQGLSTFANNTTAQIADGTWHRPDIPNYDPPLHWDADPNRNLQQLLDLTGDLTDVTPLQEQIHAAHAAVQAQPNPNHEDRDHPQTILLHEATGDLQQAAAFLDWCNQTAILDEMREAALTGTLAEKRTELEREHHIDLDLLSHINHTLARDRDVIFANQKRKGADNQTAATIADIQSESMNMNHNNDWPEPRTMLYRALDRLTHADFAITVAHAASQPGAPAA